MQSFCRIEKRPQNYKKQAKKSPNVANAAKEHELIAELNEQISNLEEAQEDDRQISDDEDGMIILESAFHPSNVPSFNSTIIPLSSSTTTLTANNSKWASTH